MSSIALTRIIHSSSFASKVPTKKLYPFHPANFYHKRVEKALFSHITRFPPHKIVPSSLRWSSFTRVLEKAKGEKNKYGRQFRILAKLVKLTRIPALIFGVYSLGYTAGIADYTRSPSKWKKAMLASVLQSVGCDNLDKVKTMKEGQITNAMKATSKHHGYGKDSNHESQLVNIAYVGEKIINSARELVMQELNKCSLEIPIDPLKLERWTTAFESLDTEGESWTFVLIDVPMPNAFVSETTPYTIYVTTSILENVISNDDELALLLGHELSHLLLAHSTQAMEAERNLKTLEVMLLVMDPTEGAMSLFFMATIEYIRNALSASHSRCNEREADELGIQLAAMSCFDTKRAPIVMKNLHEITLQMSDQLKPLIEPLSIAEDLKRREIDEKGHELSSFMDTHPPSLFRYENLLKMSKEENADKYPSKCKNTRRGLMRALEVSKKESKKRVSYWPMHFF